MFFICFIYQVPDNGFSKYFHGISNINNFQKLSKIYHLRLGTGITTLKYIRSIQAIDQNGEILIFVSGYAKSNKNLNIFKFSEFLPNKTICINIKIIKKQQFFI